MERRCIIITAYLEGDINKLVDIDPEDYIICADGGYRLASNAGIKPTIVIGDFDSGKLNSNEIPEDIPVVSHSAHKDYTDTALCIDYAKERGFNNILIIGGLGGRLDHTMANIQNLFFYCDKNTRLMLVDGKNVIFPLIDNEVIFPNREGWKISVVSHSEKLEGVTIKGTEYTLKNANLDNHFPLGVGNYGREEEIYIKVEKGEALIIMSKD